MSLTHNHPGFCDPRRCQHVGNDNVDHRSTPLDFKSTVDDFRMTIGLSRFDSLETDTGYQGTPQVNLGVLDIGSVNLDGSPRLIETDLSANDARLLAAALSCAADQLDALRVIA